ncbi:hypothetical protein HHI36_007867 [Cryptolaemus montrouzieri]|uniref:SET domain-containing protein n=1 Tax=Cryptolaemus montrouzieri TaxID=559131 RepID=A0ABD2MR40_9CUCU
MAMRLKQDIARALQSKYPESLQPKLLERRKSAELLKLKQEKTPYHQEKPFIDEQNLNPLIECASNSVGIIFNAKLGRHIIATKDIEIGEVIAVEKPAFSALTDEKWCHCHHCLTLCYCLIPCESCTQALFCSDACKDNAKVYHNFECHILATISTLDIVPSRVLPLRISIIVKNGYQDIMSGCDDLSNEKLYRSGRYREIHNLVTNLESRSASNLFERVAMTAIFYYLVKQYTDFFKGEDEGCEDTFKTVLLHLLQVSACNFHEINETERNPLTQVYELKTVGAGAYSFLSLFNHSCSPNVGRICYGTTIVLLASESIKKGDQLFENYGYHHAMHSRAERRSALKIQYFFDCACRACENDWGTYDTLPQIDFDMSILMLNFEKLANADVETARKIAPDVKKVVKKLEKHIPCKNLCEAQELLKQCFSVHGNLRRMLKS